MKEHNINRSFFYNKSKTIFFVLFVFCGTISPFSGAASQNAVGFSWIRNENAISDEELNTDESTSDSISYVFSYRNRSGVLELESNKEALAGIDKLAKRYRANIFSGKGHFAIISYIRPCDLYIPQQINAASVQASVARAYLKSMHNIQHDNVTFAFDTAHYTNYKVRVAYVAASISETDNQDIYYTTDKDLGVVVRSTLRYKPLPLIKYDDDNLLIASIGDTFPKDTIANGTANDPIVEREYQYRPDPRLVVVEILKPSYRKRLHPYFAVKSNLLTWAGVMPKVDYRYITPNLELEYFIGKRWSVNVDGTYTYQDMKNASKEFWAAASVGVEPRFWFTPNARFLGFYTGLYGLLGEFDVKLDKMSNDGYTGLIKEGGLSLGFYLPITSRLGVELGARYGYRMMNYDSYTAKAVADKNFFYYQSSYVKNALQLTGVRLLVSYRFGQSCVHKIR